MLIVVDTATKPQTTTQSGTTIKGESASSATLLVKRKGEEKMRIGGYFGFKVKSGMLPCEAEGKGLERAVEHWDHYIRENENRTVCLVDNSPVVQCAKKLARGEYSQSPRLQSFLFLLNSKNIVIQHNSAKIPNKLIETADWGSRNQVDCKPDSNHPNLHESCPYCQFAWKNDDISFASVKNVTLPGDFNSHQNAKLPGDFNSHQHVTLPSDLTEYCHSFMSEVTDYASVPFKSKQTWINLQKTCNDMRKAVAHIKAGTKPSPKEKNIRVSRFYIQHCKVDKDGLLIHEKQVALESKPRRLIVVPQSYLRGLIWQLHSYCDAHSSEYQTEKIFSRVFWGLHVKEIIKDVVSSCTVCLSTKSFPKHMPEYITETKPVSINTEFAADVMVRGGKFLILREVLTSHTSSMKVANEKGDTLKEALLVLLSNHKSRKKISIRSDNQTGFASLVNDKLLTKLNIEIILGDPKNINKNPVAERAIREIEDEIIKIQSADKEITPAVLAQATMTVNNKLRYLGYSSNELYTNTNHFTGEKLELSDSQLSDLQFENRSKSHVPSAMFKSTEVGRKTVHPIVDKGDIVMIKSERNKNECRKKYLVIELLKEKRAVIVQKFLENQLRNKKYKVKIEDIILVEKCSERANLTDNGPNDPSHLVFQNTDEKNMSETELQEPQPEDEFEEDNDDQNEDNDVQNEDDDDQNEDNDDHNENQMRTRNKPRIDYSILHRSGEKVLTGNIKIDYSNVCDYCYSKSFSNFYHSKNICERLKLLYDNDTADEEEEEPFVFIHTHQDQSFSNFFPGSQNNCNVLPGSNNSANVVEEETLPSRLEVGVQVPEDDEPKHKIDAAIKIQKWWKQKMNNKIDEIWDNSLDPPNWNHYFPPTLPVSFSESSLTTEFPHDLVTLGKIYPYHKFLSSTQLTENVGEILLLSSFEENSRSSNDEVFMSPDQVEHYGETEEKGVKVNCDENVTAKNCCCAKYCKNYAKTRWRTYEVEPRRPHTRSMTAMQ